MVKNIKITYSAVFSQNVGNSKQPKNVYLSQPACLDTLIVSWSSNYAACMWE